MNLEQKALALSLPIAVSAQHWRDKTLDHIPVNLFTKELFGIVKTVTPQELVQVLKLLEKGGAFDHLNGQRPRGPFGVICDAGWRFLIGQAKEDPRRGRLETYGHFPLAVGVATNGNWRK